MSSTIDTQYSLDFEGITYSADHTSPYSINVDSGTISTSSITTNTPTYLNDWSGSLENTITVGGQTLTERKLKALDGLQEWQEEVNKKLAILKPNEKLEEQWSELKELREQYVNLEKELTEKSLMWDILKD